MKEQFVMLLALVGPYASSKSDDAEKFIDRCKEPNSNINYLAGDMTIIVNYILWNQHVDPLVFLPKVQIVNEGLDLFISRVQDLV
jgi:hypothetical protein